MNLKSLSASGLKIWLGCKTRWADRYVHGNYDDDTNDAANLGGLIHKALEEHVKAGDHLHLQEDALERLLARWTELATVGLNLSYDDFVTGQELLIKWNARQSWSGRTVVSTEQRWSFPIKTKYGDIPMVFVIDRVDKLEDGSLEVHDYKSGKYQLNHSNLKDDLQALTYATATWINVPGQDLYWVTFDYLRDEPIGVSFRVRELQDFYQRLVTIAEQIIEMDVEEARANPTVNPECRFCHLLLTCKAVKNPASALANLAMMTPEELVEHRVHAEWQAKALQQKISQLDTQIAEIFENDDTLDKIVAVNETGAYMAVGYTSSSRRWVDQAVVRQHVSPELLVPFAELNIKEVEALAEGATKGGDHEVAVALRKAIKPGRTKPTIKVLSRGD